MAKTPSTLEDIVPEYRSGNPLVRWLFLKRLEVAERLARLDEPGALTLLDAGCGEGLLLKRLKAGWPRHAVEGMDHRPEVTSLDIPGVTLFAADLTKPGALPAARYDRLFALDVLEHLKDLAAPLAVLRAALKPGGLLVVSAPTENLLHKSCRFLIKGTFSEQEGPCSSPHYHRAATLAPAIAAAGFEPVESVSLPLPGPLALNRLFSFRRA